MSTSEERLVWLLQEKSAWTLARHLSPIFSDPAETLKNMPNFKHMSGPMDINGVANVPKVKYASSAVLEWDQGLRSLQDQGLAKEQRVQRETKAERYRVALMPSCVSP